MVANPNGADTPVGVWLDADAAPVVETSKTGRSKVKAGGKGTQGSSGTLAYRPGWHLGKIPYALQFNRGEKVDNPLGIRNQQGELIKVGRYFPKDFVWAEVEYAADRDYQDEAMKVNRVLTKDEVDALVRKAGRTPQEVEPEARHSVRYLGGADLSNRDNARYFKNYINHIQPAPTPAKLPDGTPKATLEWFLANMVGKKDLQGTVPPRFAKLTIKEYADP